MKKLIFTLCFILTSLGLSAQGNFEIEIFPVCWQITPEQDSTIYAYWMLSSRDTLPRVMNYVQADGTDVTITGGSITAGRCGQILSANLVDSIEITPAGVVILYATNGDEVTRDSIVFPIDDHLGAFDQLLDEDRLLDFDTAVYTWDVTDAEPDQYVWRVVERSGLQHGFHVNDGPDGALQFRTNGVFTTPGRDGSLAFNLINKNNTDEIQIGNIQDSTHIFADRLFVTSPNMPTNNNLTVVLSIDPVTREVVLTEKGNASATSDHIGSLTGTYVQADTINDRIVAGQAGATYDLPNGDPDSKGLPPGEYIPVVDELGATAGNGGWRNLDSLLNSNDYLLHRDNTQDMISNVEYKAGDVVRIRETNQEFKVQAQTGDVDNYFVYELNQPDSDIENLFSFSNQIGQADSPTGIGWLGVGSGNNDLIFEQNTSLNPYGRPTADAVIRQVGSNTQLSYFFADTDTIFTGDQWYLTFWFRAGTSTPPANVLLNRIRFNNNNSSYQSDNRTKALITSDTEWRKYTVTMFPTTQDIEGGELQLQFGGLAQPDTVYMSRVRLTRDTSNTYVETVGLQQAKKGKLYAVADLPVVDFSKVRVDSSDVKTLQLIADYLYDNYGGGKIYAPDGFTITPFDTTLLLRTGVQLYGDFIDVPRATNPASTIYVNLNDSSINAIELSKSDDENFPTGSSIKGFKIVVQSPCLSAIEQNNVLTSKIEDVTIEIGRFAEYGVSSNSRNIDFDDPQSTVIQPLGNHYYNLRIFEASNAAMSVNGGVLHYLERVQLHRSKQGLLVNNANVLGVNGHIEKVDSLAINVLSSPMFRWYDGFFESPNYVSSGGVDSSSIKIDFCRVFNFIGNNFILASGEGNVQHVFQVDSIYSLNIENNRWGGAYPGGFLKQINGNFPEKFNYIGNHADLSSAKAWVPQNSTESLTVEDLVSSSAQLTNANRIKGTLADTTLTAGFYLSGVKNLIAFSDSITSSVSSYTINTGRVAITQNDTINSSGALVADRATMTATSSNKIISVIPSIAIDTSTHYNLSFEYRRGTEEFNNNLSLRLEYTLATGSEFIEIDLNQSNSSWQEVEIPLFFVEPLTVNELRIKVQTFDTDDYFWLSDFQLTEGKLKYDYVRTVGTPISGKAIVKVPNSLSIVGDVEITNTLKGDRYTFTTLTTATTHPVIHREDITIETASAVTITLDPANLDVGEYAEAYIKDGDVNTVTLSTTIGALILENDAPAATIPFSSSYHSLKLRWDGTNWLIDER